MLAAAWSGAALFAVSLAYVAYFYVVRLGQPAVVPTELIGRHVAVNVALFSAFAVHHSLFARAGVKAWLARRLPPRLERSVYVWVASLLLLGVCLGWRPLPGVAWQAEGLPAWCLYCVQLGGVALTLRSAARLDIWELAGVRQATHALAGPERTPAPPLEIDGPYRWVRHPIYFGWLLLVGAAPVMTSGRLLFTLVSTMYLVIAIPFEERGLQREFGAAYHRYQAQVRWRLLPGIW